MTATGAVATTAAAAPAIVTATIGPGTFAALVWGSLLLVAAVFAYVAYAAAREFGAV